MLQDEELCIFHGHKLWFDPVDATDMDDLPDVPWCALPNVAEEDDKDEGPSTLDMFDVFSNGDPDEVLPEEELPFRRLELTLEDEEEAEMDAVWRGEYLVR